VGAASRASLLHRACCGELHETWQLPPFVAALHEAVAFVESTELDVTPPLVTTDTLDEFCAVVPPVDVVDSIRVVTLLELLESLEAVMPAP